MRKWLTAALTLTCLAGCIRVSMDRGDYVQDRPGIQTWYHEYAKQSGVYMLHMKVPSSLTAGDLHFQAFVAGPGRRVAPQKVTIAITVSGWNPEVFDRIPEMALAFDGAVLTLPVKHEHQEVISGICTAEVTFEQFRRMAQAQRFTGRLGTFTFTVDAPVQARMRSMIEVLTVTPPAAPSRN